MRFELTREPLTAYRASKKYIIIWMYKSGTIASGFVRMHPLSKAYWNICKDDRLQTINTGVESRRFVLILFASLVLL